MAISTALRSATDTLIFRDAKSCKTWLATIPLANLTEASLQMLDALRLFNRSETFAPLDRLTCLELMREPLAVLLGDWRRRIANKGLPLPPLDLAAWKTFDALFAEMEAGYRRCHLQARDGGPLGMHAALVLQRMLRHIGLAMQIAAYIHRRFDATLWIRLHAVWQEALSNGLATISVKDSIGCMEGRSSVQQAYVAVLLAQLAEPYALTTREADFVEALLRRFSHKVAIAEMPPADGALLGVDPDAAHGARWGDGDSRPPYRLDTQALALSLKRRIHKLDQGIEPQALDLPADWPVIDTRRLLLRLLRHWCEGGVFRPPFAASTAREARLVFGIADTHFLITGQPFESPGSKREFTRQEINDIAIFGKITQTTMRMRQANVGDGGEIWPVLGERRGELRLLRPLRSVRVLSIGKLVGLRLDADPHGLVGIVREIEETAAGRFEATIAMLPGQPEAVAVRAADAKNATSSYVPGLRLPAVATLRVAETLVIPATLANVDAGIDVIDSRRNNVRHIAAGRIVEHGVDYARLVA